MYVDMGDGHEIVRALFCAGGDGQCGYTFWVHSGYHLNPPAPPRLLPLPLGPLTTDLGRSAACCMEVGWVCRTCNEKGRGPRLKDHAQLWLGMAQDLPGRGFCLPRCADSPLTIPIPLSCQAYLPVYLYPYIYLSAYLICVSARPLSLLLPLVPSVQSRPCCACPLARLTSTDLTLHHLNRSFRFFSYPGLACFLPFLGPRPPLSLPYF